MILDEIVKHKKIEVERTKSLVSESDIRHLAQDSQPPRGFLKYLKASPSIAIIAEIKKGSPSKGIIRSIFNPEEIARIYAENGASALSVLTDRRFFYGCLRDLQKARRACSLPVLRKDFILDEYQVFESRAAGADAILLIAAVLDSSLLRDLYEKAISLGMDVLVETRSIEELESAVSIGAKLIGVNNRDLRSFAVNMETTFKVAKAAPPDVILVAESGIKTRDELIALHRSGIDAALIGETLMSASDPGAKLRELLQ